MQKNNRGRWGIAVMRGKAVFAILAKFRMQKPIIRPRAAINNKTNWHEIWAIRLSLIWRLSLLEFFRIFDLTIQQDEKYLALFWRKNIMQ